ncbi:MAG: AraC family transcriptional regulator [Anaerocolumna sp.]
MENFQKEMYKEKAIRGESQFPVGFYRITDIQSIQILPYHWHKEFEILYMTKGTAIFQIDDESYELKEGQALFISGGKLHSGITADGTPCSYDAIVFELDTLSDFYDKCTEYLKDIKMNKIIIRSCYKGESPWEQDLLHNLKETSSCFSTQNYGYHLAVKGRLLLLFSILLANKAYTTNIKGKAPLTENVERLKKVVLYIQEHYQSKITIDDLAAHLNMSRHYFCRFFKKTTGITPVDYINCYKTDRAAALIETTNISIMEAGMEAGFDNFSYFIKTFKRYKNCTPSEYRMRQRR